MQHQGHYTAPVSSTYGAPMGRHTGPSPAGNGDMWKLQRVPIDSGGYDPGGAYWGLGAPLYYVENTAGESDYFRINREDITEAFAAIGGCRVDQPGWAEFSRRVNWSRGSIRLTAKHIVRRDYDSAAKFYR